MEILLRTLGTRGPVPDGKVGSVLTDRLPSIIDWTLHELAADSLPGDQGPDPSLLRRHVENALRSTLLVEALAADERHPEFPLATSRQEGEVSRFRAGTIDLLYRRGGEWTIVDYKTDRVGNSRQARELREYYRGQIDGYAAAFREFTGQTARAHLLLVDEAGESQVG